LMFYMTPKADNFVELFSNGQTYANIWGNLFPDGTWFEM